MKFETDMPRRHAWSGRGRHWNFDPLQCLGPRPEILDRYISLSCLQWLPTACHEQLAYFHWPQWVTWLVTWWVTWSRWQDAGRHIGKFLLWTTLLRFSRSAQISPFSNFTKLGQLFFDNMNRQCLCWGRRKELEYMHLFTLDIYNINLIGRNA